MVVANTFVFCQSLSFGGVFLWNSSGLARFASDVSNAFEIAALFGGVIKALAIKSAASESNRKIDGRDSEKIRREEGS
jgi:hypothetical protein